MNLSVLFIGVVGGVALAWRAARSFERFRRARQEFRNLVANIKGNARQVRQEGLFFVKAFAVVVLILGVLVIAVMQKGRH